MDFAMIGAGFVLGLMFLWFMPPVTLTLSIHNPSDEYDDDDETAGA